MSIAFTIDFGSSITFLSKEGNGRT